MKKKLFLVLLAIVLAFGITVVGCDNSTTNNDDETTSSDNDTWQNVTSFSQLDGTWKAPSSPITCNYKDYFGDSWDSESESYYGNMKITNSYSNYRITFDSTTRTMSTSGSLTQTCSGGNINTIWSNLKEGIEDVLPNGITVSFNDTNHSMTATYNLTQEFPQEISDEIIFTAMGYQINQNGTKLKQKQGDVEIIFTKQ